MESNESYIEIFESSFSFMNLGIFESFQTHSFVV